MRKYKKAPLDGAKELKMHRVILLLFGAGFAGVLWWFPASVTTKST